VTRAWPLLLALWLPVCAGADDFRPSYLQLTQTAPGRYQVLWKVPALDERTVLKLQPVFPEGTRELTPRQSAYAGGATAVRWTAELKGGLEGKPIAFEGLDVTRTDILVRLARLDGSEQLERLNRGASQDRAPRVGGPRRPPIRLAASRASG
jgi:hypothetical protein